MIITEQLFDVAIVGAGFAGLAAAQQLTESGKRVCIVEARDRLGGRTRHESIQLSNGQSFSIDLGGQWIGAVQPEVSALVKKYGIETLRTPENGQDIYICDNKRVDDMTDLPGVQAAFDKLDALANELDPSAPWQFVDAEKLDNQTLEEWIKQNVEPRAQTFMGLATAGAYMACAAKDTTPLDMIDYIRNGCGTQALNDCEGGAQELCLVGGPPALATAIAKELEASGMCEIQLDNPVRHIDYKSTPIRLTAKNGEIVAKKVIVTTPPIATLTTMTFRPELPQAKRAALAAMKPGYALKAQTFYESPWWNDEGFSGVSMDDSASAETFDNSKPGYGNIVTFLYGEQARKIRRMPLEGQHEWIVDHLVKLFGPRAKKHLGSFSHDWTTDPWTLGCFSGHFGVGDWTLHGKHLSIPTRGIHWAGTETATSWRGYIEGAIQSGRRAAAEVAAATQ